MKKQHTIILKDKFNKKFIYENVYKYYVKKNKLYIFYCSFFSRELVVFNLTYISVYYIGSSNCLGCLDKV